MLPKDLMDTFDLMDWMEALLLECQVSVESTVSCKAVRLDECYSIGRGEPELRPLHPSARSHLQSSHCASLSSPVSAAARSLLL